MTATLTTGVLAAAVIDIGGLIAVIAPLAVVIAVVVAIVRMRRAPPRDDTIARAVSAVPSHLPEAAPLSPPVVEPAPDWPALIKQAEADSDHAALAALYLAFARSEIAGGRHDPAAEHLRSSLRAAAKSKNAAVQAEARLELAEVARAAGDLTTACEHWQIARGLFHGLKEPQGLGETERLMQQHGCPTDWVLNDF